MFTPLNLPQAPLRISKKENQYFVTCLIRKKKIVLTPEEWVRQHLIYYLVHTKGFAIGRIGVEVSLQVNGLAKRADVVYYDHSLQPTHIIECKAPLIELSAETVFQIATYNSKLKAKYLIVSNGIDHFIFENRNSSIIPLNDLPE